jgi:hypothetical protein
MRPGAEDVFLMDDCDNNINNNNEDNNEDTSEGPTLAMLLDGDSNSLMLMDLMCGFEGYKHQNSGAEAGGQQLQQLMGYGQLAVVQGAGQLTGQQNVDGSNILSGVDCGLWATSRSPPPCMEQQQAEAGCDDLIMATIMTTGAWPPFLQSAVFIGIT